MATAVRNSAAIIVEPSIEDVAHVLKGIQLVTKGKKIARRQQPYTITFPGGTARLCMFIDPTGSLNLTTKSLNSQELDKLVVPIKKLTPDCEVILPFITHSLMITNVLYLAKQMAKRYPTLKRCTTAKRSVHIPVRHGSLWMYRLRDTIVLEEHPAKDEEDEEGEKKGDGSKTTRNIHRFPIDALLRGRLIDDPGDKGKGNARERRKVVAFCDSSFCACLDVRFPDPEASTPTPPVPRSYLGHAVPSATR